MHGTGLRVLETDFCTIGMTDSDMKNYKVFVPLFLHRSAASALRFLMLRGKGF